ncbi:hypothetical protein M5K25_012912 [Dendrobium thyrsiflorum]|uniref:Uncharacterized protein n=1 Tax=Dendrobium thyrsiflorum TaxID=117978 RepID=A0ABD0V5Z1_DENTH
MPSLKPSLPHISPKPPPPHPTYDISHVGARPPLGSLLLVRLQAAGHQASSSFLQGPRVFAHRHCSSSPPRSSRTQGLLAKLLPSLVQPNPSPFTIVRPKPREPNEGGGRRHGSGSARAWFRRLFSGEDLRQTEEEEEGSRKVAIFEVRKGSRQLFAGGTEDAINNKWKNISATFIETFMPDSFLFQLFLFAIATVLTAMAGIGVYNGNEKSEKSSSNFGFFGMAAKKVDALEERLEGEMNQIKETVEERMSSMEGQVADLRDMMKKMLEFQTQSAASDAKGPEAKNINSEIHREEEEVEIVEGRRGRPHLKPLQREERGGGYGERQGYGGMEPRGAGWEHREGYYGRRGAVRALDLISRDWESVILLSNRGSLIVGDGYDSVGYSKGRGLEVEAIERKLLRSNVHEGVIYEMLTKNQFVTI